MHTTRHPLRGSTFGITIAKTIGGLDIGQTVLVKGKAILAIEALEGTDQCILRGGRIARQGAVVVKRENMSNEMYALCFNCDDQAPLWAGIMELLHRMEAAVLADQDRTNWTPEQAVAKLELLNEIRLQMGSNRRQARQAIERANKKT